MTAIHSIDTRTNRPRFVLPAPCSACGWQYPPATLEQAAAGEVTLDPTPTHLCRPTMRIPAASLHVGQRVFIPHFVGTEINGIVRGDWCIVEDLPGAHKQRGDEFWMRPVRAARGVTSFFVYLTGDVVVTIAGCVW